MGCACNSGKGGGGSATRTGRTAATLIATAKLPTPLPQITTVKVERKAVRVARDVDKYRG